MRLLCDVCGRDEWVEGLSVFDPLKEDESCMARSAPYFLEDCGGDRDCFRLGYERATKRADAAIELLGRIRQWDHLDGAGDGPFWKREIDKVLLP